MVRHSSPRSRHALPALPPPRRRRSASGEGARPAVTIPAPARRAGIGAVIGVVAVVTAVIGGALSLGGTGDHAEGTDPVAAVDLTGDGQIAAPPAAPDLSPETTTTGPAPAAPTTEQPADSDGSEKAEKAEEADGPGLLRKAAKYPAELIDPQDWYLTLPTGSEGSPDTVQASELTTYLSKYFSLNDSRDGVVFTANAGGVTTENSHYPRSELREMDGGEKAAWDGGRGTHTMELVQAITETPKAKPDVIAGQIHDGNDDVMQIHLSGKQLTVKYADGDKDVVLNDDYQLGTKFSVKIQAADNRVKVWYDGALSADLPLKATSSYFKAGAYVNSNTSKGEDDSAEGQVVIYSLKVTHT